MKIKVIVHSNSKEPRVKEDKDSVLHVYVKEPASEGKANKAVIEKLAEIYKTPKTFIELVHGQKSKIKIFGIKTPK